ncbi:hypothetical protein CHLNCDRAFT_56692 [Chlorella variabilis]|uniref:RCK C-terminal domain-containing protein n=1 Tax=Chlorella variabilis TaxID=554065 RepID=E1Z4F0_CHLVA|nr:hypothetical protein CHLNCDRAFT_56692 [Chlorella variabilis]EFN59045.1 hypothetical protein CHLNCDRAFT_56692 [Chlorella variabilis]|eukprot:XP_005851147.1 hypothetical protein CHLNCDRAFT_56692 [Chlorella variabilis]
MATPASRRGLAGPLKRWAANPLVYNLFVLSIFGGGVLLMVLPAELLTFKAPEKAELNLETTFSDLSSQGWLSLAFIAMGFILMVFDVVGADLVMNMVLALMVIFKIITIKSALVGYGNSGLMTVVTLFMVAQGITSTGGADFIITKLLGTPKDTMLAQVRMCLVTALFSSFVNDTPVFCIMLPIVLTWAAKARLSIRQLLIPLSYCCLLGGLNTTIGTSTNLVVTGAFDSRVLDPESEYYQEGLKPIELFGIAPYGIPNTFWGIIYIVLAAPFLLTGGAGMKVYKRMGRALSRKAQGGLVEESGADFFFGVLVTEGSPVVGHSIQAAGLRNLDGQYVTSVRRGSELVHAVGPEFMLATGDVLYLSGLPDGTDKLTELGLVPFSDALEEINETELPGLSGTFGVSTISVPKVGHLKTVDSQGDVSFSPPELVEATIRKDSDIVGQTIRGSAFRSRFHAAVVAIKRNGMPLKWTGTQIGDEVLKAGDTLLLDVAPQFWTSPAVNEAFTDLHKGGQVRSHNEFLMGMRVTKAMAGKTVQKSGMRQLPNAFLVAIDRAGATLHAVSPDEELEVDDILWFAGNAASVRFIRNTPGLVPLAEKHASKLLHTAVVERRLVQAIVAPESPLVGTTIRESRFREQFNAAVVAVARKGERIRAKPGDIELRSGDILLLDTGSAFAEQHKASGLPAGAFLFWPAPAARLQDSKHFQLIIEMPDTNPPRYLHTAIAIASIATAFTLYATSIIDILPAATIVVAIMLLTGCMSPDQARRSIRWDVYLMIAGSFGVSAALEQSGGAAAIANLIVDIGKNAGGGNFTIAAVYVATTLISQIIANNSAAALMFPIAATISKNDNVDIYLLSYAIMLGASSVFMSSFGYQTNLMALAAGGHSSRDFLKFGTPMQVVLAVVSIVSLIAHDSWGFVWLVTGAASLVVMGLPQVVDILYRWKARKHVPLKEVN